MIFNLKKFFLGLTGFSFVVLILILSLSHFILKINKSREFVLGYLISLFIFILGFIAINWAFKRSMKAFMGVVLGGMFVRVVLIGGTLFLLIQFTNIHIFSFVLAFLVFYIISQFYEIKFIHSRLSKGKKWQEVFSRVSSLLF